MIFVTFFIYFAIVPVIANGIVSQAQLKIEKMAILQPTESTFNLGMRCTIKVPLPSFAPACRTEKAKVSLWYDFGQEMRLPSDPVQGMKELGQLILPGQRLGAKTTIQFMAAFRIHDAEAMGAFISSLLTTSGTREVTLRGAPRASMLGIPLGRVILDVQAKMSGLASLKDMQITKFELPGNGDDGVEAVAEVGIDNPTQITAELGSIDVGIGYKGDSLGTLSVIDLKVNPGRNILNAAGHIKPANPKSASPLFSQWISGGSTVSVDFVGGAPESAPSWIRKGIKALEGSVTLPDYQLPNAGGGQLAAKGGASSSVVRQIEMPSIGFSVGSDGSVTLDGTLVGDVATGFGFDLAITKFGGKFNILDRASGSAVGSLELPLAGSKPSWTSGVEKGGGQVRENIKSARLKIVDGSKLGEVAARLLGPSTTIYLSGDAQALTDSDMGELELQIPIAHSVTIKPALNGLQGGVITRLDVVGADAQKISAVATLELPNNSPVSLQSEPCLPLNFAAKTISVGSGKTCNVNIASGGKSTLTAEAELTGDKAAITAIVHDFINGVDQTLDVKGAPDQLEDSAGLKALLTPVVRDLNLAATLKPLGKGLLEKAAIMIDAGKLISKFTIGAKIFIDNPFSVDLKIVALSGTVSVEGGRHKIGTIERVGQDIVVPANKQGAESHVLDVKLPRKLSSLIAAAKHLIKVAGNCEAPIQVAATMTLRIGSGYELTTDYKQEVKSILHIDKSSLPWLMRKLLKLPDHCH